MGSKDPVLLFEWQLLPFGGVLLSFKREPDGSSSSQILHNLSYKLFVGFAFASLSVQLAGRTQSLVLLL